MKPHEALIADVVKAAGNEVVGRIRLQKILYLLDQKGMGIKNADFRYYHYGPYSRALDEALERAKALNGVKEEIRFRKADGAPFSVFKVQIDCSAPSKIGNMSLSQATHLIDTMKSKTSTVIELAATVHWLIKYEEVSDWKSEIVRRKGKKTEGGRLEEALGLLQELELSIAS